MAAAIVPREAPAWGPLAHQIIYRAAIARMSDGAFRDWLSRNVETGTRQSMTPDIDWKPFRTESLSEEHRARVAAIGAAETPTHFFDGNLLLPSSAPVRDALARSGTYSQALPILRAHLAASPDTAPLAERPWELGSVPWRTAQLWHLLVEALRRRDFRRAHLYAAALTHYAAESTNALHGDSRYDGLPELTRGPGLHLAYEMHGFEARMEARGVIRPADPTGVWQVEPAHLEPFARGPSYGPIRDRAAVVATSLAHAASLRDAPEALSRAYGSTRRPESGAAAFPLEFFSQSMEYPGFRGTVESHAEVEIARAASFAAALLDGAYAEATARTIQGIPLPPLPIPFDREFAIENYPVPDVSVLLLPETPSRFVPLNVLTSPCLAGLAGLARTSNDPHPSVPVATGSARGGTPVAGARRP
jgi:hypothetical protein